VNDVGNDALQRRVAGLISGVASAQAVNGDGAFALGTSLGAIRKRNEDRAIVMLAAYADSPERNFCAAVLSDGMGGLLHGDEAAVLGVSMFIARILRTPRLPMADRLRPAALAANDTIYAAYRGRAGATLSAALVDRKGRFIGVNIGDSRIYGVTSARELLQLSQDDTLAGVLGQANRGRPEQHQLVQYLGMGEGLEPHLITSSRPLESILLTTDGIHNAAAEMFARIVRGSTEGPRELVRKLLTMSDLAGGRDNSTAVSLGTKLDLDVGATDHGLTLAFWSVSHHVEVWIPVLAEEGRESSSERALSSNESDSPSTTDTTLSAAPLPAGKKMRHGKKAQDKAPKDDTRLPPEEDRPVLDVTFPKDK
jgi:serine/threonine protein phosphatase PrpC